MPLDSTPDIATLQGIDTPQQVAVIARLVSHFQNPDHSRPSPIPSALLADVDPQDNYLTTLIELHALLAKTEIWQQIYESRLNIYRNFCDQQDVLAWVYQVEQLLQEEEHEAHFTAQITALEHRYQEIPPEAQDSIKTFIGLLQGFANSIQNRETLRTTLLEGITRIKKLQKSQQETTRQAFLDMHLFREAIMVNADPVLRAQLEAAETHIRTQEAIIEKAHRDERHCKMTDLPNRLGINEVIDAAIESGKPMAIAQIDLDRFKELNDTHSHEVGDQALRIAGMRFAVVRDAYMKEYPFLRVTIGHPSGDEFQVCVELIEEIPTTCTLNLSELTWKLCEELRKVIDDEHILCVENNAIPSMAFGKKGGRDYVKVTSSIGFVQRHYFMKHMTRAMLLMAADYQSHLAKQTGQDQVTNQPHPGRNRVHCMNQDDAVELRGFIEYLDAILREQPELAENSDLVRDIDRARNHMRKQCPGYDLRHHTVSAYLHRRMVGTFTMLARHVPWLAKLITDSAKALNHR